jgi:hypothetical protein
MSLRLSIEIEFSREFKKAEAAVIAQKAHLSAEILRREVMMESTQQASGTS